MWQNITLVTHPDHRTGRRGNLLSICASTISRRVSALVLTLGTSTFEAVGSRAVPHHTHDPFGKIRIQALGSESVCLSVWHRAQISSSATCAASSAIHELAETQARRLIGHSLVWPDSPKGTTRTFLAGKETECASFLVASLPGSSPYPTRAPRRRKRERGVRY